MAALPPSKTSNSGGVYLYQWLEGDMDGLTVKLDKIREDSRSTGITGEILVRFGLAIGHIHQTRYSLLSTRSRNEVAGFCKSRLDGFDWSAILEQVSIRTVEAWRAGEPVVRLGDVVIPESLQYRLAPFLVDNEANLLYGEGGLGKSYLAAYFTTVIQEGLTIGGYAAEHGPTLYLDYETSNQAQARRFRYIYNGQDIERRIDVLHRFCYLPLAHDIEEIQRVVVDHSIQFVVVDSAGPACGGEPESAAAVIPFFTALRSLRVTTLIIAHKSKNTGGAGPFGSVFWMNMPRNVFELKKAQEEDSDTIHLAMVHKKTNDGVLMRPFGLRLKFQADAVTVEMESVADVPELAELAKLGDRILAELAHGSMSYEQLAESLDQKETSVKTTMNRLVKAGLVKQIGTETRPKRWGLPVA